MDVTDCNGLIGDISPKSLDVVCSEDDIFEESDGGGKKQCLSITVRF